MGVLGVVVMQTFGLQAQLQVSDLAGDWYFAGFSVSSDLTETYYNGLTQQTRFTTSSSQSAMANEMLVDTFFREVPEAVFDSFSVSPTGVISGADFGQVTLTPSLIADAKFSDWRVKFLTTRSSDILLRGYMDGDIYEMAVAVKKPTAATTAALAGDWIFIDYQTPRDLTETYLNTVTQQTRMGSSSDFAGANEILVDVFFRGGYGVEMGAVSIAANGTITGAVSGSAAAVANCTVTINFGEGPESFQLNEGANFMVRTLEETDEQRLTVIVKSPTSTTLADLAGPWRLSSLLIPNRLRETYYNTVTQQERQSVDSTDFAKENEKLVDVYFEGEIEALYGVIGISPTGVVTGLDTGTVTINSPSTVTVNMDGDDLIFYPTANHDLMVSFISEDGEQEIMFMTRVPVEPMKLALDFDGEGPGLLWQGTGDVRLQSSTTLSGWTDVNGSNGQSAHQSAGGTAEFFRLVQEQELE